MMAALTLLQKYRLAYQPDLPAILQELKALAAIKESVDFDKNQITLLKEYFSETYQQPLLSFSKGSQPQAFKPLKVGVVLSGGQAPGGHNVIAGLFDALKKLHPESSLIGFCDGPGGIIKNKTIPITSELLSLYRNQGGFDIIGSGRTKIEAPDQFVAALATVKDLNLDGLVVIGGDDSNTNAAFLADYFQRHGVSTKVIGVPKTIDGDLKNEWIEVSFGFDTACKIYSEIIGNILKDTLSAKKYYYFIKLMGRSASHITLECALKTQVNMALISEEVAQKGQSIEQLVHQIADMISWRAERGKHYGAILIPEGIIEFIPEFKDLIQELNHLLAYGQPFFQQMEQLTTAQDKINYIAQQLSQQAKRCFLNLPLDIQYQLLLDRDPHGNVQVSKIETEKLFIALVEKELEKRKQAGLYRGKFTPQAIFCGYEGRSGLPSNFDSQYCYALGHVAALLLQVGANGYITCIKQLTRPVEEWQVFGVPIFSLLHSEVREGKQKAVIRKALVDLNGSPFKLFESKREEWMKQDDYVCPGPIQFFGPLEITDTPPLTLTLENSV